MMKIFSFLVLMGIFITVNCEEKLPDPSQPNVRQKALYLNKDKYDKALEKKYQKEKKNQKPMKIYYRKDGSIDTMKTLNESKR